MFRTRSKNSHLVHFLKFWEMKLCDPKIKNAFLFRKKELFSPKNKKYQKVTFWAQKLKRPILKNSKNSKNVLYFEKWNFLTSHFSYILVNETFPPQPTKYSTISDRKIFSYSEQSVSATLWFISCYLELLTCYCIHYCLATFFIGLLITHPMIDL